jgi:hypothetical protein
MLIQDFIQVPLPYARVRGHFEGGVSTVLTDSAVRAYRDGEQLSMRLGPSLKHPRLGKKVHLDVGTPYERRDGLVVPICWWASGASWLFPFLEGDLEVMPVGENQVQITLMGRYEPPLSQIGVGLDRALMHRVADGSVRTFLNNLATALDGRHRRVPSPGGPA